MLLGEPGGTELGALACGQVWVCPVCAYAVRGERAREAGLLTAAHLRAGGQAWAVVCDPGEVEQAGLAARWQLLSAAWRRVVSGSGWAAEARRSGRVGVVWSPEVTWSGQDGWRVVLRVLLLDHPLREELHQETVARWTSQWAAGAGASGARVSWRPVTDTVAAGGHVAAVCDAGAGRRLGEGALGPADLLARARRTGEEPWWELWREYTRAATPAARGHRSPVTFSRGLRSALLPGLVHRADADLAVEQARATVPALTGRAWRRLAADGALQLQVLDAALRGPAHLSWTLADHGLAAGEPARLAAA
ncbi:hypothetical protein [Kitasatospora sp. HPMI-4]|uniref:hypothetical protein n=1 Tax=Kitasatospora sp. HPMI-4 TaxID=3448443 RepID=UPI003F1B7002